MANRPWLLPFIAERAKDPEDRDLLRSLIRSASAQAPEDRPSFQELVDRIDLATRLARAKAYASAHQPEHRPSFAQMVDHLDRFENQKGGH